jgi:hypothetical protein
LRQERSGSRAARSRGKSGAAVRPACAPAPCRTGQRRRRGRVGGKRGAARSRRRPGGWSQGGREGGRVEDRRGGVQAGPWLYPPFPASCPFRVPRAGVKELEPGRVSKNLSNATRQEAQREGEEGEAHREVPLLPASSGFSERRDERTVLLTQLPQAWRVDACPKGRGLRLSRSGRVCGCCACTAHAPRAGLPCARASASTSLVASSLTLSQLEQDSMPQFERLAEISG